MTTIGSLPDKCRGCVAWELDADAVRSAVRAGDTEFEKEVWLSGVMLTWGSAGQIVTVDDEPVGFALFAPPTAVPGAAAFPTSPVSPDAVLLTTARILPQYLGQGLGRYLLNGVVTALTRRGVRAIEVFGREDVPARLDDPLLEDPVLENPLLKEAMGAGAASGRTPAGPTMREVDDAEEEPFDPAIPRCLVPAGFARAVGFVDIAPHHRYPRLRFELGRDIGWKAEVEAALEKLFTVITVPASPSPLAPELVGAR